jgi:hypothetical protein
MNVEIGTETPIFLFWEYLFQNFGILFLQCVHHNLARDGYIEFTCCCVQARFLGKETKILFLLFPYIQL